MPAVQPLDYGNCWTSGLKRFHGAQKLELNNSGDLGSYLLRPPASWTPHVSRLSEFERRCRQTCKRLQASNVTSRGVTPNIVALCSCQPANFSAAPFQGMSKYSHRLFCNGEFQLFFPQWNIADLLFQSYAGVINCLSLRLFKMEPNCFHLEVSVS